MDFKIGVLADGFQLPFEQAIAESAKLGIDGVQIYAVSGDLAPDQVTPAILKEKKNILNAYGIKISAICGDLGGHGFENKEENAARVEKSKKIVDTALNLGTNIITTHIGVVPEDIHSEKYKTMQEACNQLAEYANQNNAYFAVETGPEPADRLKKFLDGLSSKGVAVNFDPANLIMLSGDDPVAAVDILKDYIVHTHAKDGVKLERTKANPEQTYLELPLGMGFVDFPRYLKALSDIDYHGYLTIEREVGENPAADIKMAVTFLEQCIK